MVILLGVEQTAIVDHRSNVLKTKLDSIPLFYLYGASGMRSVGCRYILRTNITQNRWKRKREWEMDGDAKPRIDHATEETHKEIKIKMRQKTQWGVGGKEYGVKVHKSERSPQKEPQHHIYGIFIFTSFFFTQTVFWTDTTVHRAQPERGTYGNGTTVLPDLFTLALRVTKATNINDTHKALERHIVEIWERLYNTQLQTLRQRRETDRD